MNLKHFIFDLDGTLIDTEHAILKTWQDTLKEYGYEYTLDEIRVVLGVTTDIGLKKLNANVDENYICKWQVNYEKYCSNADFFDGAKEMLEFLKENNCSLGAVSSRSKNEYAKYFRKFNLEEFFTTIVLEDDTENHKPYPDPLFKYLELTGVDKDLCIYIGDMPTDIQCANNAGIISGLVTWNDSGVSCSDAKMSFSDPKEVCDLVNATVCSSSY